MKFNFILKLSVFCILLKGRWILLILCFGCWRSILMILRIWWRRGLYSWRRRRRRWIFFFFVCFFCEILIILLNNLSLGGGGDFLSWYWKFNVLFKFYVIISFYWKVFFLKIYIIFEIFKFMKFMNIKDF